MQLESEDADAPPGLVDVHGPEKRYLGEVGRQKCQQQERQDEEPLREEPEDADLADFAQSCDYSQADGCHEDLFHGKRQP